MPVLPSSQGIFLISQSQPMPRLLKYNPLLQNVFAVSAGQFSFLRVSCSIVFYFSSASLIVAYIYLLCRDLCPLWDWITWDTQNLCLTLLLLKYLWQCFQLMGVQLRCSSIDKSNFLWQRLNKHQTVCFMPNKCDFCRNEHNFYNFFHWWKLNNFLRQENITPLLFTFSN